MEWSYKNTRQNVFSLQTQNFKIFGFFQKNCSKCSSGHVKIMSFGIYFFQSCQILSQTVQVKNLPEKGILQLLWQKSTQFASNLKPHHQNNKSCIKKHEEILFWRWVKIWSPVQWLKIRKLSINVNEKNYNKRWKRTKIVLWLSKKGNSKRQNRWKTPSKSFRNLVKTTNCKLRTPRENSKKLSETWRNEKQNERSAKKKMGTKCQKIWWE